MKKIPALPKFLQPQIINSLERIGRNNDGGYVIDKSNILDSDALITFGINDDWSFEEHFHNINPLPIFAFDGSISSKLFIRNCMKSILKINKPKIFFHWLKTIYNYKRFFTGNKHHFKKFVGINSPPNFISLSNIINEFATNKYSRIYFKIDIEGMEYRLLEELIINSSIIEGLVIEFHDLDLHLSRIENFVKTFPLNLVHTHCNNYAEVSDENIPMVIECSFSRSFDNDKLATEFPNKLDMPNDAAKKDYQLIFI
jgi:hypothetical protein